MSQEYALCDIKVIVDYSQERQNSLGPFVFATDGTQLDASTRSHCIIDPVNLSTFGKPLPMTNDWKVGTGASDPASRYYRFQKSDFTFVDATKWKQQDVNTNGNAYIYSGSGNTVDMQSVVRLNGAIGTTDAVKRNEALFFSYRKNTQENTDDSALIKLYWSNPTNKDKDVQLHFNSDGSCNVFRGYIPLLGSVSVSAGSTSVTGTGTSFLSQLSNGTVIYDNYGRLIGTVNSRPSNTSLFLNAGAGYTSNGSYFRTDITTDIYGNAVSGPQKVQSFSRTESNYSNERPVSTVVNPNDKFNDVYIIPCRGKELLVLTSYGLNFSYSFDDLNIPDPPANNSLYNLQIYPLDIPNVTSQPIILPSGSFSIQVSQGKVSWQLAKLNFLNNWSVTSQPIYLKSAPPPLPVYLTGTISGSFGSTEITGTGTSFNSQINTGDRLYFYSDTNTVDSILLGTVNVVNNDTSLYLDSSSQYKTDLNAYSIDQKLSGSIGFTAGNGAIQGTGTSFSTELALLDTLYDSDNNYVGLITGIINNTNLVVDVAPGWSATGVTYWKNVNNYSDRFVNGQAEIFSTVESNSTDNLSLKYYITDVNNTTPLSELPVPFDNNTSSFRIKIVQENEDDSSITASSDKGFMFYSLDDVFFQKNVNTYPAEVDITAALESLSLSRAEDGAYNLSFSGRKQLLEDAGMDRPLQIANRPVKVMLSPRRELLTGTISYSGTGNTLTGTGTSFLTELYANSSIYLGDGTFIGIATTINSNTSLGFWSYDNNTYINETYNIYPKGDDFILYEGYLSSPEITYLQSGFDNNYTPNYEKYSLLNFTAYDKLSHLNKVYYSEGPNFDNTELPDIFNKNIIYGGSGNNDPNQKDLTVDYTINTYQVPINRNNSNGQYNFVANLGDTVGGFLEKMRSDLAQNFTFFCRPDWYPKDKSQNGWSNFSAFKMIDQNFIPFENPYYNLFLNEQEGENLFGIPSWESWKPAIRSLRRTYEAPEANRIFIVGLDKTNGARLQFLQQDLESQNPYLSPEDRPTNWLGDVHPFVMINDKLNSETDVQQAANQFYNKLTPGRNIIEFECDLITTWDYLQKYTPTNRVSLSGQIDCSLGGTAVTGTSTAFLSEVQVGDFLYLENGSKVGYVRSITTDFELVLVSGSQVSSNGSAFYNDYTQYLNQYRYFDIGDIVGLYDEFGDVVYYRILSWDCDFIKETTSSNYINARRARYRAKQVPFDPTSNDTNAPVFAFNYEKIPAANSWIVTSGYDLAFKVTALDSAYDTVIYSIVSAPSGMTVNSTTGEINWTPTSLQSNQIYSVTLNAFDGVNNTTYDFTIRVYDNT